MQTLLITTMRDEAPYILEWVAYHRMIGFHDILIYSNDCSDGTEALLDRLQALGLICHERNDDYAKKGVQWTALERARTHPLTEAADWLLFADVDEFVNIKCGAGHLSDLFAACPEADAFTLTWRLFGHNGQVNIHDIPVIRQFTRAAPFPCFAPWTASQFKTLYRNTGAYKKLGVHRPKAPVQGKASQMRWVNGSGQPLGAGFTNQATLTYGALGGMDLVALNHYSLKSAMGFLVKAARGLPNRASKPIDIAYWTDRNFNTVEELSIQRHLPTLEARMAELLADPELAQHHHEGLNWHRRVAAQAVETLEGLQLLTRAVGTQRHDIDPKLAMQLLRKRAEIRARDKNAR